MKEKYCHIQMKPEGKWEVVAILDKEEMYQLPSGIKIPFKKAYKVSHGLPNPLLSAEKINKIKNDVYASVKRDFDYFFDFNESKVRLLVESTIQSTFNEISGYIEPKQ